MADVVAACEVSAEVLAADTDDPCEFGLAHLSLVHLRGEEESEGKLLFSHRSVLR